VRSAPRSPEFAWNIRAIASADDVYAVARINARLRARLLEDAAARSFDRDHKDSALRTLLDFFARAASEDASLGRDHEFEPKRALRSRGASGRSSAQGDQRSGSVAGRPDQWGKVEICREPQAGQMKLRPFSISGSGVDGSSDRVSKAIGVECRHIGLEQVTKKPGTPCD
jgi:hypothetical protein